MIPSSDVLEHPHAGWTRLLPGMRKVESPCVCRHVTLANRMLAEKACVIGFFVHGVISLFTIIAESPIRSYLVIPSLVGVVQPGPPPPFLCVCVGGGFPGDDRTACYGSIASALSSDIYYTHVDR